MNEEEPDPCQQCFYPFSQENPPIVVCHKLHKMHKQCLVDYTTYFHSFTCMLCDPLREKHTQSRLCSEALKELLPPPIFKVGDRVIVTYEEKRFLKPNRMTFGRREEIELSGVIISRPPDGTVLFNNEFEGDAMSYHVDVEDTESWEDLPGSGSMWVFPDMTRQYFVRLDRTGGIDLHNEGGIRKREGCLSSVNIWDLMRVGAMCLFWFIAGVQISHTG